MDAPERRIVVVGFDGSAESAEAVRLGLREADQRGAELRVVTAYTSDWSGPDPEPPDWQDRMRRHTEALQSEAVAEVARGHADPNAPAIEHVVLTGHAGEALVEQSRDAELLVVGSRGHNALERALLGSVSTYCLHHARCPVLVVRLQPDQPHGHIASLELAGNV